MAGGDTDKDGSNTSPGANKDADQPHRAAGQEEQETQAPPGAARAAPEHIGQSRPDGMDEQAAAARRRPVSRYVVVGLALLLIAGLAAVLSLPDVSNRLALPWAPNAPLGPEPSPAAVEHDLAGPDTDGQRPTPDGVADALNGVVDDPQLGELAGAVVDPADGTVLWERDADQALTPASATKLLTSASALLSMDASTRFSTRVVEGAEPGQVVLVGDGDPTLSALAEGEETIYPDAPRLDDLAQQVAGASDGEVDTVAVDLSAYTGAEIGPGWSDEYIPSSYAAPVVPAMLDGARTDPTDVHSTRHTDPADELVTGLADRLDAEVAEPSEVQAGPNGRVLGEVHSAPLTDLLDPVLSDSDNVLAEALARQVARAEGAEPSFAGAADSTLEILQQHGFDTADVQLEDGSGLSQDNKIPPRLLAELLAVAAGPAAHEGDSAKLRPLFASLPVAGGSGTLAGRYDQPRSEEGQGWVRAKTGTLSGVNTLAGTVLDSEGRVLAFAMMAEESSLVGGRRALDAIATTLAECGCD